MRAVGNQPGHPLKEPKRRTRAESVFYRTNLLAPLVLALQNSSTLAMKKEVTKANSALCIRGLIHSALSRALKVIIVHGRLSYNPSRATSALLESIDTEEKASLYCRVGSNHAQLECRGSLSYTQTRLALSA